MVQITDNSAPGLYQSAALRLKHEGHTQSSRVGNVCSLPYPITWCLTQPRYRIISHPRRDANHCFHVAETVWMLAGSKDVDFVTKFNSGYSRYAEDDGEVHGAYGWRWRMQYDHDQLIYVINALASNPDDRRVVIQMWDASLDLGAPVNDVPCNVMILPRVIDDQLNLHVVNRSNDFFWGAFGANIVHMTYLHEFLACALKLKTGNFYTTTTNLHYYTDLHEVDLLMQEAMTGLDYPLECSYPILRANEDYIGLLLDCEDIVSAVQRGDTLSDMDCNTSWAANVAIPIIQFYLMKDDRMYWLDQIDDLGWRQAIADWWQRRGGE